MELTVKQENTKYMFLSKKTKCQGDIKGIINYISLEVGNQQVSYFKYPGVSINDTNCVHEEIKLRLKSLYKTYFAMSCLFKLRLLSIKSKEKSYTTYFVKVVKKN